MLVGQIGELQPTYCYEHTDAGTDEAHQDQWWR